MSELINVLASQLADNNYRVDRIDERTLHTRLGDGPVVFVHQGHPDAPARAKYLDTQQQWDTLDFSARHAEPLMDGVSAMAQGKVCGVRAVGFDGRKRAHERVWVHDTIDSCWRVEHPGTEEERAMVVRELAVTEMLEPTTIQFADYTRFPVARFKAGGKWYDEVYVDISQPFEGGILNPHDLLCQALEKAGVLKPYFAYVAMDGPWGYPVMIPTTES